MYPLMLGKRGRRNGKEELQKGELQRSWSCLKEDLARAQGQDACEDDVSGPTGGFAPLDGGDHRTATRKRIC